MGALPPQKQIQLQQIPNAPSWLAGLLTPLNKILGALYDLANQGTTIPDQIPWQLQDLTVSVTNGTWVKQQFKQTAKGTVKAVMVGNVQGTVALTGPVVVNSWSVSGNQISINSLTGLGNGTYTVTLLVVTG